MSRQPGVRTGTKRKPVLTVPPPAPVTPQGEAQSVPAPQPTEDEADE